MNENHCFLNGQILPLSEAKVSIEDIGLLRGYGIYDGLAVVNGKCFRFADHWKRFLSGAHALNLNVPITEVQVEKKIEEMVTKSNFGQRANVRLILTGGQTIGGIEYNFEKPTFYMAGEKWQSLPKEYYENGAKLITYRHMREMPEHKTINYIRAVLLQDFRKQEKAVEILYTFDGEILECATSNIFIVKNGVIITPSDNILYGITRKAVLELCDKYEVEQRSIREEELQTADEVFITSSFKDIMPIVQIDDYGVGNGQIGPITQDLMVRFAKLINM